MNYNNREGYMRNISTRVKRLEADSKEETCMIVPVYPRQNKEEAMEEYFKANPHMRDYKGIAPFVFLKMFREKNDA